MTTPAAFVAAARSLIGVPFVHQGHTVHGVDCVGLLYVAAQRAGVNIMEAMPMDAKDEASFWTYTRRPQRTALDRLNRWAKSIENPENGCLILFQFYGEAHPQHFGIYTDAGTIIHAMVTQGKVCENGYRSQWTRDTHSLWRLPGIDYP